MRRLSLFIIALICAGWFVPSAILLAQQEIEKPAATTPPANQPPAPPLPEDRSVTTVPSPIIDVSNPAPPLTPPPITPPAGTGPATSQTPAVDLPPAEWVAASWGDGPGTSLGGAS